MANTSCLIETNIRSKFNVKQHHTVLCQCCVQWPLTSPSPVRLSLDSESDSSDGSHSPSRGLAPPPQKHNSTNNKVSHRDMMSGRFSVLMFILIISNITVSSVSSAGFGQKESWFLFPLREGVEEGIRQGRKGKSNFFLFPLFHTHAHTYVHTVLCHFSTSALINSRQRSGQWIDPDVQTDSGLWTLPNEKSLHPFLWGDDLCHDKALLSWSVILLRIQTHAQFWRCCWDVDESHFSFTLNNYKAPLRSNTCIIKTF